MRRAWQRLVGSFFFVMATFAVACVCLEIVEMATIPITKRGAEKLKAELLQELEQRQQKKGWLARLLSR